ncbi:OmpH family outer membrane protein [Alisedimentitalea sp. MJ-SS2]|uniref:OmpH family outer membrane protein n=1 Tax=Aliisedimentitalea sp. MJ-SS2 TaxID=3049795 RepID=UPI002906132B|nr:OmpH family outer membrane protein [Alisedimentitalea sp. MJ-SS2]MDU8929769.1 OmpH family outer membrane protein [Alisedimentitalea sp. MJ-SS2]
MAKWLMLGIAAVLTVLPAQGTRAQEFGLPDSAILLIDPNRLFAETRFGQRVQAELKARHDELSQENRQMEGELEAEELALTQERSELEPEVFRAKADAFHEKVQRIRNEQVAKANAWQADADNAQRQFLTVAGPVLEEMMAASRAAVLLDLRAVLWRAEAVDVTSEAVRRIDLAIGDGGNIAVPATTPSEPAQPNNTTNPSQEAPAQD